ncbi:hypothetical protein GCM10025868_46810 [Angustibacter aerolatus]|uniref:Uncharacterized protein n=1 Tax=Angustibacter aerolatus TaxID=1162965 RepID=A0ABQ6JPC7_9ACTN|nr:hypothetical protein [Angustibacter aerolatus]GMA89431.1 hypothetical protein GCM10025868_46810 [Angustibacter aerolatus]
MQKPAWLSKEKPASREQWWKRAQWAMDLTQSGVESKKALGLAVLTYLGTSEPRRGG